MVTFKPFLVRFFVTNSLQKRFKRVWQPSSGSAKILSKYHLLTTRREVIREIKHDVTSNGKRQK